MLVDRFRSTNRGLTALFCGRLIKSFPKVYSRCRWVEENCLCGGKVVFHICSHTSRLSDRDEACSSRNFSFPSNFPFRKPFFFVLRPILRKLHLLAQLIEYFSTPYGLCMYLHRKRIVYLSTSPSFTLVDPFSSTNRGLSNSVWLV